MEYNRYPVQFGEMVRKERDRLKLSQIAFYKYLFSDTDKTDENIKKKMNAIENGKQAHVDIDLFMALCEKCEVSADFLIGTKQYRNYDLESVCEYTGLNENAVCKLHNWKMNADNGGDISIIGEAYWGDEGERQMNLAYDKIYALQYLRILNCLFSEYEIKERIGGKLRKEKHSNISLLHAMHLLCITKPYRVMGEALLEESLGAGYEIMLEHNPTLRNQLEHVSLNAAKIMVLQDENDVWYPLNMDSVFEQMARNRLNKCLDRFIENIKENGLEYNYETVHPLDRDNVY